MVFEEDSDFERYRYSEREKQRRGGIGGVCDDDDESLYTHARRFWCFLYHV